MKTKKKGFTIVELVIVIAVIAILAAVLIPTFSGIIKKANESTDTQLVRNLNTALVSDAKEHKTMQSALDAAKEFGFDVDKINTKVNENEILWDSVNDCFVYKKETGIEYIPNSKKTNETVQPYQYWQIANDLSDQTYSIYAGTGWAATVVGTDDEPLKVGFDAGEAVITSIKYVGVGSTRDVVIRTNSYDTELTVNAPTDTVAHYDAVGQVEIISVDKDHSYHEFGSVQGKITFAAGNLVVEEKAVVPTVVITAESASDVKINIKEQTETIPTITAVNDDVAEAIKNDTTGNFNVPEESVVACNVISEAFSSLAEGYNILNGDITIDGTIAVSGNVILDLNDHTITTTAAEARPFDINENARFTVFGGKISDGSNGTSLGVFRVVGGSATLNVNNIDFGEFAATNGAIIRISKDEDIATNGDNPTIIVNNVKCTISQRFIYTDTIQEGFFSIQNTQITATAAVTSDDDDEKYAVIGLDLWDIEKRSVILDGVKIVSNGGACIEISGGNSIIKNCDFSISETANPQWVGACVAGSWDAQIIVESGTYTSPCHAVYCYTTGANITIYGGNYIGTKNVLVAGTSNGAHSSITVNGGTFTGGSVSIYGGENAKITVNNGITVPGIE